MDGITCDVATPPRSFSTPLPRVNQTIPGYALGGIRVSCASFDACAKSRQKNARTQPASSIGGGQRVGASVAPPLVGASRVPFFTVSKAPLNVNSGVTDDFT